MSLSGMWYAMTQQSVLQSDSLFTVKLLKIWGHELCSDRTTEIHTNPAQCSQKVGFRYVISWKLWMNPGPILLWSSGLALRK